MAMPNRKMAQEVLHRRLLRQQAAAPGKAAQQVQRQREHLQRHEHGEQVVGRREQQHAADREEGQRINLGVHDPRGQPLALLGAAWHSRRLRDERADARGVVGQQQHAGDGEHEDRALDEQGRPVHRHRAHRRHVAGAAVREQGGRHADQDGEDERGGQAAERQHQVGGAARPARQERLDQHAHRRHAEDDEHRRKLAVLDAGRGDPAGREQAVVAGQDLCALRAQRGQRTPRAGHGAIPYFAESAAAARCAATSLCVAGAR
jgi:hypothetical protein